MAILRGNQFKPFYKRIDRYFTAYGRWPAVFGSPLFAVAVLIAGADYSKWLDNDWTTVSISLLPSLLGFSLGTYAILFSLVTKRVKGVMRAVKDERNISALEQVNATFFHFIFVQVLALLWAFSFQGTLFYDVINVAAPDCRAAQMVLDAGRDLGAFIGFLLLIYSVALMVGAALAVYRLALIVDPAELGDESEDNPEQSNPQSAPSLTPGD